MRSWSLTGAPIPSCGRSSRSFSLRGNTPGIRFASEPKESFTTYSKLDRDTLVLVLSAAYRDKLEPYTWWFPIVGRVPYKGFFDFGAAKEAAKSLYEDGFDVALRPSSAFSTLGWFNDPLTSTTLSRDSLDLVNTVIHEVTHNTFYAPGQAVFNESFASFVGARGAAAFFRSRGQPEAAVRVDAEWGDDKVLGDFWTRLASSLDSAYKQHPDSKAARIAARDTVYLWARKILVSDIGPQLVTVSPFYVQRVPLDNASLLARRVYAKDLDLFDQVYAREGKNFASNHCARDRSREERQEGSIRCAPIVARAAVHRAPRYAGRKNLTPR